MTAEAVAAPTAEEVRRNGAFGYLQPLGEEARYRAVIWLARALDLPVPYRRAQEDVPF